MTLHELTLAQVAAKIHAKEVSPVELTEAILARVWVATQVPRPR